MFEIKNKCFYNTFAKKHWTFCESFYNRFLFDLFLDALIWSRNMNGFVHSITTVHAELFWYFPSINDFFFGLFIRASQNLDFRYPISIHHYWLLKVRPKASMILWWFSWSCQKKKDISLSHSRNICLLKNCGWSFLTPNQ